MDTIVIGVLGIVAMLVALALGFQIALAMLVIGLVGTAIFKGFDGSANLAVLLTYYQVADVSFLVIPLFVFMGVLAGAGGITRNIYRCMALWAGRLRAALGIATVFSIAAFGLVTGSSVATAAVFSKISAPEMRRQGFDKRLAYGLVASAGPIAVFIPPSIIIVFYSVLAGASTGRLLIAGLTPGILLTLLLSAAIVIIGYIKPAMIGFGQAAFEKVTWRQRFASVKSIWPIFLVGLIVIGGIFGGVFSPSEAAAWGALVMVVITVSTARNNRWKMLNTALRDTISVVGMIFFILASAAVFSRFLMLAGVTDKLVELLIGLNLSAMSFTILMCVLYLVMGCFLDATSMLSITVPIIMPAVRALGIDPVYFAMPILLSVETGLITPPVGLNVFAAKAVAEADVRIEDIFIGCVPFMAVDFIIIALLIAFPPLSTFLPNLMLGK
jgi:C4-dicarboxylate transporter DctM subunit